MKTAPTDRKRIPVSMDRYN